MQNSSPFDAHTPDLMEKRQFYSRVLHRNTLGAHKAIKLAVFVWVFLFAKEKVEAESVAREKLHAVVCILCRKGNEILISKIM